MKGPTTESWLAALEKAHKAADKDGISAKEIAERLNISHAGANVIVEKAIAAGKMVYAGRRTATRVDGVRCYVPVYKMVSAAKSKKG